jgi:3-hydroxyacyl-[acyl-carrier-protein] dehydratase
MSIINPEKNSELELTLDITKTDNSYTVKNTTKFEDTIALKLTTNFKIK